MDLTPIDDIVDILKYRKRNDLAKLLRGAAYSLNVSSNYGSRLHSVCTTVEIYSSLEKHDLLTCLKHEDELEIIKAFHIVYPVKDAAPEIVAVEFFVNPHDPIPTLIRGVRQINTIDFEYILEQISKCDEKIKAGDYDGAVTNAKSLVESICQYIFDEEHIKYGRSESLPALYRKLSEALAMNPSAYEEKPFKEVLSGCFSMVNGIANIRNLLGDAHGKSRKAKYKISERHAVLTVSVAKAVSEYLYSSYREISARHGGIIGTGGTLMT